jgi:hypothetical protein
MQIHELNLFDKTRNRKVPILIYTPDNSKESLLVVIFNPGYQEQKDLIKPDNIMAYRKWEYLAEFFNNKGYVFIVIQHDLPGDTDGLETIDPQLPATEARYHLWIRGEQSILFVINELKQKYSNFNFDKIIIAGHSNGGDITKFFANNYEEMVSNAIIFDGRRCPIKPGSKQRLLIFEATDTSTDIDVLPDEGSQENPKRTNLEWIIIKPKDAMHISYRGDMITEALKEKVLKAIEFFLNA